MTNTPVSAKVRFVKCPTCREILAELPEITVYRCGGCGTILQAKSRKVEMSGAEAASRVKDDVAGSGQKEAISSNQDISYPATDLLPSENNVKPEDCNEFRSPNEKESTMEDTRKLDDINQQVSREPNEGEESERALQEGNNFLVGIQNSPETKEKENEFFPLGNDQTTQNPLADSSSVEIVAHYASHTTETSVVNDDTDDVCTSRSPCTEEDRKPTNDDRTPAQAALERKVTPVVPLERDQMTETTLADSASLEIVSHDASETMEPREEVNDGSDDVCTSKGPSTEKEPKSTNNNPTPAPIALERKITVDPLSSDNDHLVHHRVSVSSDGTMESSKPFDRNSELGNKHGHDMISSPTTKSYYAQDGSESSYDGTDYQSQQYLSHPFRRRVNNVDSTSARGLLRNRFRVNNAVNSDQELNYQRRPGSSSILHNRHHHSMNYRNHDEFYSSKSQLHSGGFTSDYRTGNARAYHHEPLPYGTNFQTHKMDLLRTVGELKDQLHQMQLPKYTPNHRIPASFVNGNSSSHYNRLEPGMEFYAGSNLNPRRAERYNEHRVPFSGEAAHYNHNVNSSLSNRYPQQRYHSAQLPLHSTHMSSFSSPQHYSSSEIKRIYLKEKYHTEKRHLRPIAGAAPFLTCYHCFRLLELPEDFLLVNKRCHHVRCNACGIVLKFSLDKKAHLVPFQSHSKNKTLMGTVKSTGLVSMERKMGERTSALHLLMGYESPSEVYDD